LTNDARLPPLSGLEMLVLETGWRILTGDQGSGILNSLVLADGLAVIPEDARHLPAGSQVEVLLLE